MKAFKSKNLCKEIADEKDLDHVMVNDIISFFYEDVKNKFKDLKNPRLKLDDLGTFEVKEAPLKKYISKNEKFLTETNPDTLSFNYYEGYKKVKENVDKIKELLTVLESEKLRKQEVKEKRNEFIKNLEK
jgi:nucleoid DNA-binding protein